MSPANPADSKTRDELVALTLTLLKAIAAGDWQIYTRLCDPSISCFEPEARGHLVEGMEFHKFYFDLPSSGNTVQPTISSPHVRMLGEDAAVVSYVRLTQVVGADQAPVTRVSEETRVWQRQDGQWRHVHFHRSLPT
ncbi:MAG: DUF4440 domain-containing protein [Pirellulaceae bacterium]